MSDGSDIERKRQRIVEARLALMKRFGERMESTPALSDRTPHGSGPPNRHGMPRLPPGQTETKKWPVLDLGILPKVDRATWTLTVDGACKHPTTLDFDGLLALEQVDDVSDFHCVTTWSRMDMRFRGVRFLEIAGLVEPDDDATHVLCHSYDGYTVNLPLAEALKPDVLLVHTFEGEPLPHEHGGPVRVVTPQLYAWKGAKWIRRIELLTCDRLGFWEERGYSNTAHPWRNDRYS